MQVWTRTTFLSWCLTSEEENHERAKGIPRRFGRLHHRQARHDSPAIDTLKNVRVNGVPILELEGILRTPRPFEVRPTTKHREAFAAGCVQFDTAVSQVDISTKLPDGTNRETPDLLVDTSETSYDVEAVRVDETAEAKSHLYEIQARYAELPHDNPELKIDYPVLFTVNFENVRNLTATSSSN